MKILFYFKMSLHYVGSTLVLLFPIVLKAQTGGDFGGGSPTGGDVGGGAGNGCGGGGGGLQNPLQSCTITEFLLKIIDILLVFALPIIIFFIMYGGFLMVTAKGEPGKIQTGRNAILWAVVGGVIILGADLILEVIKNTVENL